MMGILYYLVEGKARRIDCKIEEEEIIDFIINERYGSDTPKIYKIVKNPGFTVYIFNSSDFYYFLPYPTPYPKTKPANEV